MQGKERTDRQLLDAQALVGHLVPPGSMFAFLAAHRGELFADEEFADLFPSARGRPSVPASVMASVMVLQVLHDYSDAEAAGNLRLYMTQLRRKLEPDPARPRWLHTEPGMGYRYQPDPVPPSTDGERPAG